MPFPFHDRYWTSTLDFVKAHGADKTTVIAPDEFVEGLPAVHTYAATFSPQRNEYPWVIVHKGQLDRINHDFLSELYRQNSAVCANEVFVVFQRNSKLRKQATPHVRALQALLENWPGPRPHCLATPEKIVPLPAITTQNTEQVRQRMNQRFRTEPEDDEFHGYPHPFLWDKVRYREFNRVYQELLAPINGIDLLEIGCGSGRAVKSLLKCRSYTGIDLSDVAIELAQKNFGHHARVKFQQMDAQALTFADASFDVICMMEIVEHVIDAEQMLREAYRVLRPGGKLVLNSANRDSLHLRILRHMGLPEFRFTIEHFREFGYTEMVEILHRLGFTISKSAGLFLMPYLGNPEIGDSVSELTYNNAELIETLRELGTRVGPEYAFGFVLAARK